MSSFELKPVSVRSSDADVLSSFEGEQRVGRLSNSAERDAFYLPGDKGHAHGDFVNPRNPDHVELTGDYRSMMCKGDGFDVCCFGDRGKEGGHGRDVHWWAPPMSSLMLL